MLIAIARCCSRTRQDWSVYHWRCKPCMYGDFMEQADHCQRKASPTNKINSSCQSRRQKHLEASPATGSIMATEDQCWDAATREPVPQQRSIQCIITKRLISTSFSIFSSREIRAPFILMALMPFSYCLLTDDTLESATVNRKRARRPE